ncbi:unnamed protein product [Toxocara canis]|uniref:MBT domain-containing protein 1 n=1 Tax=Toxocara canis TaxID=6265 RepID=A0A3P7GEZ2_TOXCA|nr:unnamed protein product [Toxocara canis]
MEQSGAAAELQSQSSITRKRFAPPGGAVASDAKVVVLMKSNASGGKPTFVKLEPVAPVTSRSVRAEFARALTTARKSGDGASQAPKRKRRMIPPIIKKDHDDKKTPSRRGRPRKSAVDTLHGAALKKPKTEPPAEEGDNALFAFGEREEEQPQEQLTSAGRPKRTHKAPKRFGDYYEEPVALRDPATIPISGLEPEAEEDESEVQSPPNKRTSSAHAKIAGYRLLVRYEGMDQTGDEDNDFWISIGSAELRHVGFCAEDTDSRFLVPPMLIAERRTDWQQYLLCQLHAYRTLPAKWPEIQHRNLNNCKFKIGDRVELLDGLVSMRVRPALIEEIVGGRILVKVSAKDMNKADMQVQDDEEEDNQVEEGVWMDQCSPLIFYVGWACKVGYQLLANDAYMKHATEIANALKAGTAKVPFSRQDARPEQFQHYIDCCSEGDDESSFAEWEKGMKLEILDPLDTWKELRVATVIEVLADGYLRLGFDGEEMEEDCIPIHCASPLLFPVGYCEKYGIKLKGPQGEGKFDWKSHLKQSKSVAAPDVLFDDDEQPAILNKFKVGAKLEAVDMCEPHLICVATVAAHKGRLLQIKFDGWDDSYDQLFDYRSNCIFPIGWCEANGYKLEAPRAEMKKKLRGKK